MYTKAIELTSVDAGAQSILHANRSMIHLNMGQNNEALSDAEEAIKLDANYIKAYYRKAMACSALNNHTLAKTALEAGLALKPDDKELQGQLTKVEEKIRNGGANAVPTATKRVTVSHNTTTSTVSTPPPPAPSSSSSKPAAAAAPAPAPASSKSTKMETEEDDEADLERLNVRGYKKTADGRTTTFFNHDMDEETKKLIGSIAPKKLEVTGEVITTGTTAGSAWNAAGTYEEKIYTPWVTEFLGTNFQAIRLNLIDGAVPVAIKAIVPDLVSLVVEVTGTENVNCHAQVTLNRGKRKHVCDYSAALNWTLLLAFTEASGRPPVTVEGQISVVDLTADKEYEIDQFVVKKFNDVASTASGLPSDVNAVVTKSIKASDSVLQKEILQKLNAFWTEFKSK